VIVIIVIYFSCFKSFDRLVRDQIAKDNQIGAATAGAINFG